MKNKLILFWFIIPVFAFLTGCSNLDLISNSTSAKSKILRESTIRETALGTNYKLYQLEITLNAGTELPIILYLANGAKVDGFFYLESGDDNISFSISGNSTFYTSDFKNLSKDTSVSDRFSFTASTAQGLSYMLSLKNTNDPEKKTRSVIFLEVIYPGTEPLFIPLSK